MAFQSRRIELWGSEESSGLPPLRSHDRRISLLPVLWVRVLSNNRRLKYFSYRSISARVMRGTTVRGYHRRKSVRNLDLNSEPPIENCDQGEHSSQMEPQAALIRLQRNSLPTTTIDVDAIDDDIVESSARAFAEAKNKSRRDGVRTVVDVDSEEQIQTSASYHNKRRKAQNQVIDSDLYINLEGNSSSTTEKTVRSQPPIKSPVFSCPICMGSLVKETSTKCGHIFCEDCIKTAVNTQGKCPTCRKKVTMKELIRVYLPATG